MAHSKNYPLLEKTNQVIWSAIDWVFPPSCIGCGRSGLSICDDCLAKIKKITGTVCRRCAAPLSHSGVCENCLRDPQSFEALKSMAVYEGITREAVIQLKYERNIGLADEMAKLMFPMIASAHWPLDIIIPIPLSEIKKKERGYNQAEFLARPISWHFRLPLFSRSLCRIIETQSQVNLNISQRRQNVAGAFLADPETVKEKNILIIDDVFTTGATMRAASDALKLAGANHIYAATFAKSG